MNETTNEPMRREIAAQPEHLARVLPELRRRAAALDVAGDRVLAGGCGDSHFAAMAMAGVFRAAGLAFAPATAMELVAYRDIGPADIVVPISISGATRQTVHAAAMARRRAGRVIAVTGDPDSALAAAADATLTLPVGPTSRATPHTLDYSATLMALAVMAERLVGRTNPDLEDVASRFAAALESCRPVAAALAAKVSERSKYFFLGAGPSLGTALYAAAKFHEAGGLVAIGAEIENFIHGMNFMIEPGDLVCLFAQDDVARRRAATLADGLVELTAQVCTVGLPARTITPAIEPGLADDAVAPFVGAALPQTLALAVADRLGLAVDRPRAGRPRGEIYLEVQRAWMVRHE